MSENKKPTNIQIFLFFIGFVTLFTLVFVLGVIVGKGLGSKGVADLDANIKSSPVSATSEAESSPEPDAKVDEPDTEVYEDDVFVEKEDNQVINEKIKEDAKQAAEETPLQEEKSGREPSLNEQEQVSEKTVENELGYVKKTETAKLSADTFPATDPEGNYTVQVGSFKEKEGAEKILSDYRSKGYPAFIKTAGIDDDQKWYRVRIGTFGSRDVAKIYFELLKKREKDINGFITTNN